MARSKIVKPANIDGVIRPAQPRKRRRIKLNGRLTIALALVLVASVAVIVYVNRPDRVDVSDVDAVVKTVDRHYLLPTDETPALATVTDKDKVSTAFRGRAENGDRILIYQKNAQAIVYRPAIDRVVAVVPVSIDTPQAGQQPQ